MLNPKPLPRQEFFPFAVPRPRRRLGLRAWRARWKCLVVAGYWLRDTTVKVSLRRPPSLIVRGETSGIAHARAAAGRLWTAVRLKRSPRHDEWAVLGSGESYSRLAAKNV